MVDPQKTICFSAAKTSRCTIPDPVLSQILNLIPEGIRRKIKLAFQNDTRVILVKTPETHEILDLAINFDRAKRNATLYSPLDRSEDRVNTALVNFYNAKKSLSDAILEYCKAVGVGFKPPSNPVRAPVLPYGKVLVETMKAEDLLYKMKRMYLTGLSFLKNYDFFKTSAETLPENERIATIEMIENLKNAIEDVAEEI